VAFRLVLVALILVAVISACTVVLMGPGSSYVVPVGIALIVMIAVALRRIGLRRWPDSAANSAKRFGWQAASAMTILGWTLFINMFVYVGYGAWPYRFLLYLVAVLVVSIAAIICMRYESSRKPRYLFCGAVVIIGLIAMLYGAIAADYWMISWLDLCGGLALIAFALIIGYSEWKAERRQKAMA
jgi:hypothetical protein